MQISKPCPLVLTLCALLCAGCGYQRHTATTAQTNTLREPLPSALNRQQLTGLILGSLAKPVMGRRASLRDVSRVAVQMGPIVAAASHQPQVQGELAQMSRDEGVSREAARARWVSLQEADLLLESGGDPDAVSSAGAVGVAQWMAGTGEHGALAVNLAASKRLTPKIEALEIRVAWRTYLQKPQAGTQALSVQLEALRAKRRRVDMRYDPRASIFAQTRYLLGLYTRFPGPDWLFQAYHGGEAGVTRTLRKYLGPAWPGSAAEAIRHGDAGLRLTFEDVYLTTTPHSHATAFSYLYSRGDDHRHYWWKLLAAQAAIALYRRDPAEFTKQWESLLPGRAQEAVWYPNGPALAFADLPAIQAALQGHQLVRVDSRPGFIVRHASQMAALRPEAKGLLILVANAYQQNGGSGRLTVGDLTLPQAYFARQLKQHPPPAPGQPILPPNLEARTLPGGGPPPDFNNHTTGWAFDILRPYGSQHRKILECTLGYYKDRQVLWWMLEQGDGAPPRYHIVPNPRYAAALAQKTGP